MDRKSSSNTDTLAVAIEEETFIITLFSCDNDSYEGNDYINLSQDSIDSSELVDDSDDEAELITEFCTLNKKLDKMNEKSNEITTTVEA